MEATAPRVKRKDGLKRQGEIMAAALKLFAEKGFAATSINDIIEAAGAARGTFYLHFTGKGDLLKMIVETYLRQLDAVIETLDISMDLPGEELRQLYRDSVRALAREPEVKCFVKVMLRESLGTETQERVSEFFEKVVQVSARYIAQAQQSGRVVRSLEPVALSVCIVGAVKELLLRWTTAEASFDLEASVDTAIEVYFRGMLA
ncbi:MAG TPA: TetR/AcrR family transcriptional regulator [Myxococcales bacterium]|jgi:AcrR family transcriptional regulator